jgi:hypothetical protein
MYLFIIKKIMLMLDHHINDGALAPRQGHEQCEGGPSRKVHKLRNNSWKPYAYIVFTTGRPLCHEVLPRALARGTKLT